MTETAVKYDKDADGIVTLTLDDPNQSANTMNELYKTSMAEAVEKLYAEAASDEKSVTGVVIASAKKTFFAGGDLKNMIQVRPENGAQVFEEVEAIKATLRKLETFPKPVVAAINGAALGGGLEIALAAQHRIALDARYDIGLPEVSLGLLPGGGGVTRVVRLLGIMTGLMDVLGQGTKFKPAAAKEKGLVDELVSSPDELVPAAKAWIKANPDEIAQPWDKPGYKMPGGKPTSPALAGFLPAFPPILRKQLKQSDMRAPKAILSAAVEGAMVDFDTATRIESRYFVSLVTGQQSKNMIQAFFFDLGAIGAGTLRPDGVEKFTAKKVGVLGAGMMGAGIAYSFARAGAEVVLKDVAIESAERGKDYTAKLNEKAVSRGKLTQEKADEILNRITATVAPEDFAGVDVVVEAVFEDVSLKQKVFSEIAPFVNDDAVLCSNTSTLPITELAKGIDRPADFIGLHFFSPVDKMPLVEIIKGAETNDVALAKAYDVVQQIKKTPIVVNDSRGFYTSRVIGTQIQEGLELLAEGFAPYSLERAATQAGFPVGPLQIADELNHELMVKIARTTREAAGVEELTTTEKVLTPLIEAGRSGKLKGAGFYDYADGKRGSIWAGLGDVFPVAEKQIPLADAEERMLFIEALETAKCFEEGVITSAAHANIGSIFGIGFPPQTGGAAQFITGYEAADGSIGIEAFLARAEELAETYGERFRPTPYLRELAAKGEGFPA
ncbi:3-hydroxyacyl-CoA dehydrogenase NAD-binding domain-containing protein [Nocardioides panzhihuensis]|uniref:3-hydroxyacyl-CoA dehydrogenase/enoyl-CoA hydratase/3-hydroxybutyryl-CoA epimerase n=1 Tax=Nocardioides panzhihuensis TaxID=860243 RepID=A0A7Z0DRT9_9ACTN|nr:3-hydroxyacyl-CoA dehydrogenase NAD-binding domain-containing protein [Nocardioides panzhihuensis]NYI80498.1 3-hydroxyacyl-CoA dehydrogenase/enoyl-CoA hydratase/3-hydroxybutyryl-CoA epimerase [Nocardioides panzhihuensis]